MKCYTGDEGGREGGLKEGGRGLIEDLRPGFIASVCSGVNLFSLTRSVECKSLTLFTVINPTIIGLRKPVIVPTVLVRPMIIQAYRGAISNMLTLYPECIKPEAATPIHMHVTAIVAVLA